MQHPLAKKQILDQEKELLHIQRQQMQVRAPVHVHVLSTTFRAGVPGVPGFRFVGRVAVGFEAWQTKSSVLLSLGRHTWQN